MAVKEPVICLEQEALIKGWDEIYDSQHKEQVCSHYCIIVNFFMASHVFFLECLGLCCLKAAKTSYSWTSHVSGSSTVWFDVWLRGETSCQLALLVESKFMLLWKAHHWHDESSGTGFFTVIMCIQRPQVLTRHRAFVMASHSRFSSGSVPLN